MPGRHRERARPVPEAVTPTAQWEPRREQVVGTPLAIMALEPAASEAAAPRQEWERLVREAAMPTVRSELHREPEAGITVAAAAGTTELAASGTTAVADEVAEAVASVETAGVDLLVAAQSEPTSG